VEDLETGARVPVGVGFEGYGARLAEWLERVRMKCLDKQIDYELMRMDQPMDTALRKYLKGRVF
jgi:hypothetical protein